MKKTVISFLLAAGSILTAAQLKDFAAYDQTRSSKVIISDSFEGRHRLLSQLPPEFEIKRGYGQNATGGMRLRRTPGGKYSYPHYKVKLKPETRYQMSVDLRAVGITTNDGKTAPPKKSALGGIDFANNKKWVAGHYIFDWPRKGSIDWKTCTIQFTTPREFTDAKPALFLAKHLACPEGVYWDNFTLTELGETPPEIFPILPKHLRPDAEGNIKVRVHDFNEKRNEKQFLLFAVINGREFQSRVEKGFAFFKTGALPVGEHKLELHLADLKEKRIISEAVYPLFVSDKKTPAGAVTSAEDGRILVDGKPFFPLGFYFEKYTNIKPEYLDELKKAGANTLLVNRAFSMAIGRKSKRPSFKAVKRSLDHLHKNNFKVIFSMLEFIGISRKRVKRFDGITDNLKQAEHLVGKLWNHPAILSWYVSDENPVEELGMVRDLRFTISRLDPFHPVTTLTDKKENYVYFGSTGDILMSDRYPIRYRKDPQSMVPVHESLEQALSHAHLGNWFVPQCFNWGIYRRHEKFADFRFPSELEIRSQCLAALNHRVRGIIFYAFDSLIRQEAYGPEGAFAEQWPKTANVVKLLKELEPFFLSLEKPLEVKVKSKGDSRVEAWRHSADGKEIVVITSDGPGKGDAVIDAGRTGLKSRFGFTRELGGGKYQFSSVEIASDILE